MKKVEFAVSRFKEGKKKIVAEKIDKLDIKSKAKIMKSTIKDRAIKSNFTMD